MMPTLYIDGDACPVKAEAIRVAGRHHIKVVIVSNSGLRPSREAHVQYVLVSSGFDAADEWIAERAGEKDIVVTADIPLAARCIAGKASVISPAGSIFTEENIGAMLAARQLNAHLRETGASKGYNASFSARDRSQFLQMLDQTIVKISKR